MTIAKNGKEEPPFGLKEGDELTAINNEDVLDLNSPDELFEVIQEASWPKTLTFRRLKGTVTEELHPGSKGSAVALTIVKPAILSGWDMPFELAHFGEQVAKYCTGKEIVLASPEDACKPLQGQEYDGKLVLVIRGGCMFSLKANHLVSETYIDCSFVCQCCPPCCQRCALTKPFCCSSGVLQAAKGSLGMIVINTDNKLIRMPTSPKDKVALTGPSMLVGKLDGTLMQTVLKVVKDTDQPFMTRLAGGGTGCNMLVGDEKYRRTHAGKEDGFLHVWGGTKEIMSFEIKKAAFGGELNDAPVRAIIGDPITGCDEKGFSNNVRNALVFVTRGGCSFEEKARRIQAVGGKGAVVVNTRGKITAMTPGDGGAKDISIPVVMIEKGSLEKLRTLVAESSARELLSRMNVKR
jgi:hypothetical protein